MSTKVKKAFKTILFILMFPVMIMLLGYVSEFILQLGRIVGTIIRIIMNL